MDNFSLESFLNYCDYTNEMEIADESFSDLVQSLKGKVQETSTKIKQWYYQVIPNADYFKEAKLDPQMNKDLIQVLRVSQPRTDINFRAITNYYSYMNKHKDGTQTNQSLSVQTGGTPGKEHTTSLLHEVERSTIDIDESLKAAKKSMEYKRILSNKYSYSKREKIPLGIIISDLKKSGSDAAYFEGELKKLQQTMERIKNPEPGVSNLTNRMNVFIHKIIEYYHFRISILQIYLKRAKTSLTEETYKMNKNVKENDENRTKSSTHRKGLMPMMKFKSPEQIQYVKDLYKRACDAETWEEYKPLYDELSKLLHCEGKNIEGLRFVGLTVAGIVAGDDKPVEIPLGGRTLYHNSPNGEIKQLDARWKTPLPVLFPERRVYFHMNFSTDRYGAKIKEGSYVYTPVNPPKSAFRDPEMGRTAIYVATDKPIKVKKVDFNAVKDKKLEKIDLEFNKKNK